jgi:hypothetical protein
MEGARFDELARTVASSGSRRRLLGALLAGALGSLRIRATRADESGTEIADASGGNDNLAAVVDRGNGNDTRCQPKSQHEACEDRCDRVVNDGCGGEIDCSCDGEKVCAEKDGVCCRPEQLCDSKRACCRPGETCGPGDACCPTERVCLPSNTCCAAGKICAPGVGVCCAPENICTVGGVPNACCGGIGTCIGGMCVIP